MGLNSDLQKSDIMGSKNLKTYMLNKSHSGSYARLSLIKINIVTVFVLKLYESEFEFQFDWSPFQGSCISCQLSAHSGLLKFLPLVI